MSLSFEPALMIKRDGQPIEKLSREEIITILDEAARQAHYDDWAAWFDGLPYARRTRIAFTFSTLFQDMQEYERRQLAAEIRPVEEDEE